MELVREHAAAGAETAGLDRHHRDLILRIAARIRESPAHAPSVEELARTAGYSPSHFSRVFLKVTGVRPQDYIINARIERARQLLAESDLTIGMVADAPPLGTLATVGACVALFGVAFETIGDLQLVRFKRNPANQGKVMQSEDCPSCCTCRCRRRYRRGIRDGTAFWQCTH